MTVIRQIMLAIIGLSVGGTVAAGVFAFITMLRIVPRLASRTNTSDKIYWYETCIIVGGTLGNIWHIYQPAIPLSYPFLAVFGFFVGAYVGCLAMALAEVLRVIPIFTMRLKLVVGLPIILAAIGIGKMAGGFFQFFWR